LRAFLFLSPTGFYPLSRAGASPSHAAGIETGMWPADTNIAYAPNTPIAALLLAADPRATADLERVQKNAPP
jgi:hypothetical protein